MLQKHLSQLFTSAVSATTGGTEEILLEKPKHKEHGDFSCSVAMKIAKQEKKNPREVAQQILDALPKNEIIEKTEIAGPGFINIILRADAVAKSLMDFDPTESIENENPKKVEVEFGNPNIAKPLHFGHFRGLIIGESLARLLRFTGNEVLTDNFIGDWGTQFGKLIVAIRKWGNKGEIDKNPTEELVRLYRKFHDEITPELAAEGAEEFRKMEVERDKENFKLWEWIVEESMNDFYIVANRLDAHFDVVRGESFYEKMLPDVLKKLEESGVAIREEEGALVVPFPEEKKLPNMIFQKTDGATLYQTRDLAKIIFYDTEGFDEMVYIVGNEQSLHFRQLFQTAKMLGLTGKWVHVGHGLIKSKEGGRMSSRGGKGVGLEEVLDEAFKRSLEILGQHDSDIMGDERNKLAEEIAMGALKFNDLSQNRTTDITFDWDKMLSFEGFSAPFLQYSAVRCTSILRKAGDKKDNIHPKLTHAEEQRLAKKILEFSSAVQESANKLEPHHLAKYLFELAGNFNKFYAECSVLKAEGEERKTRLFLTKKTGDTLKQGLYLLGIKTPERM